MGFVSNISLRFGSTLHFATGFTKQSLLHALEFIVAHFVVSAEIAHLFSTTDALLLDLLPLADDATAAIDVATKPQIGEGLLDVFDGDCLFGFFLGDFVGLGRQHAEELEGAGDE